MAYEPTQRDLNLAQAAGVPAGKTVTIAGNSFTMPDNAASSASKKKVENKRLDDHPPLGDQYLLKVMSDAVGNYFFQSRDPKSLATMKATVTEDGKYSTEMVDKSGTRNSVDSNGVKTAAASTTTTTAGHNDSATGGGVRSNVGKGKDTQNGEAETKSTDGPKINTSNQSNQNYGQGGNGRQVMEGDQSIVVNNGLLAYKASKGFSVNSDKSVQLFSQAGEFSINAKAGNIAMTSTNGEITLNASKKITLQVADNRISITPQGIAIFNAATGGYLNIISNGTLVAIGKGSTVAFCAPNSTAYVSGKAVKTKSDQGTTLENSSTVPPSGQLAIG